MAVIDFPSFTVKKVKSFDTNMDVAKSQKMASFLMGIPEKYIVAIAVKGDVAGAVTQEVWDTLVSSCVVAK